MPRAQHLLTQCVTKWDLPAQLINNSKHGTPLHDLKTTLERRDAIVYETSLLVRSQLVQANKAVTLGADNVVTYLANNMCGVQVLRTLQFCGRQFKQDDRHSILA